jgi:hypothetical protein
VQQQAALFTARVCGKNVATQSTYLREPWAEIIRQLSIDFTAQALRESRAFSGSGDGDLQRPSIHNRPEEEVAIRYVIDAIAENTSLDGLAVNGPVDPGLIRSGNHKLLSAEIGGFKRALSPFDRLFVGKCANFCVRCGGNYSQECSTFKEASHLVERNHARANHEATAPFQFQKDRQ